MDRTEHSRDGCIRELEGLGGGGAQVAPHQEAAPHGHHRPGGHVGGTAQPGLSHVEGGGPECLLQPRERRRAVSIRGFPQSIRARMDLGAQRDGSTDSMGRLY